MLHFSLLVMMRVLTALVFLPALAFGQVYKDANTILETLTEGAMLPEKILSARSVVLYAPDLTSKEIHTIHDRLVQTGIDAVAYFETDRIFAGEDVTLAFSQYFLKREIDNFVIIEKRSTGFRVTVTLFSGDQHILNPTQAVWRAQHESLQEVLRMLYSTALNAYRKQNMLVNDVPEAELTIPVIEGRRTEAFAADLKVDRLAVQKFGNEALDKELEDIMRDYPFKYALVENTIPEPELRKQGYFYILRFVCSRGPVAKQLLGYEVNLLEAVVSISYDNGNERIKTIPADTPVYKFYTRQIQFNNVYLGTRWDADVTWQQGLKNFISGFRKTMRVN
jgi:hypothetical protein